jgi:type IV secretion system protein VirD4
VGNITGEVKGAVFTAVVNISRIAAAFQSGKQLHNSRFARIHELTSLMTNLLATDTSLLLGTTHLNNVLRVRQTKTRRELGNLLVVAPTRGGKGLLATAQLLTWNHSVIVNDIKGDLYAQTAGYRATLGPVYVIDPFGVGHRYDPLYNRHTEDELLSSATHLLYKPDEGDGAIFTQRAAVMLTQLFLAARQERYPALPYVRSIIRSGLPAAAQKLNSLDAGLATQFLDVELTDANLNDRFLLSSWGTLSARMRPILTETVVRSLAGADFRAGELMTSEKPITVYLRWPERDLLALSPLVRLLWGSIIDELITTYDKQAGENCNPVLLLIDEAGRTAIPSLADHATTVVGRGVSLWVAIQSLSQLETVYGRARANTLRDNMETQIYYRPGSQETAEYLERCLGRTSEYAKSHTEREGAKISEGHSEQGVPLLTAQEIRQMGDEDIIGFHRRLQPFQARRMDWRRFPLLTERHRISPPQLPVLPLLDSPESKPLSSSYIDPDDDTSD